MPPDPTNEPPASQPIPLTFYPAYCNPISPTWDTWVKLTAHDIHNTLCLRPGYSDVTHGFKDSLILFYLNHPIQFVQIVGVVVAFEDYHDRFWLFTVDDSSGEVIEVTCRKPEKDKAQINTNDETGRNDHGKNTLDPEVEDETARIAVLQNLDIGMVVQAKGTLRTFREVRQIQLKRIAIIPDTTAEMLLIDARTKTLENVLSKPWMVSPSKRKRLLREAQGEGELERSRSSRVRDRELRRRERETRHADQLTREYEREEMKREQAAEKAREQAEHLQKAKSI